MSEDINFAKEQLGTPKAGGGSISGITWNKDDDILETKFPADRASVTKRGVLGKIARVYDPLGLVSPMTLSGKRLYREAKSHGMLSFLVNWQASRSSGKASYRRTLHY